ncbi:MAG: ATP-binding protein, partial [Syntrophobacteraceae bacterium]
MRMGAIMRAMRHGVTVIFALALLLFQSSPVSAEEQTRHSILIIYSFDRSLPFNVSSLSGLTSALEPYDLNTFEMFQENLDLDRTESSNYLDSVAAFYNTKYASKNFDAIVTFSEWSLNFLLGRCGSLSPGTPVVAVGVSKEKCTSEGSGRKIIPVLASGDTAGQTIDLILHLQPNVRKIYIISGTHPVEATALSYVRKAVSQYRDGPEFVFMTGSRYDELLGALKGLGADDAIFFLSFMRDGADRSYTSQFVAGRISETAGCPVYGMVGGYMGIVGGSMVPVYRRGLVAGQTLLGLFGMKNFAAEPGEIRVPPLKQVDERQMGRWHLSERNLPEGYEVVNRAPSLLRDYRGHVAIALLFFFAQSALIFRLFVLGRIRRRTEEELRGTCEVLGEKREELNLAVGNLRESEATLQSILSSIPVGVLMIDAGTETVRQANRAAAELLGTPLEEMPGSPCPACFRSFIPEEVNGAFQYGSNSFEDRIVNGQGREVYVLITVDRVSIGGRTHLIGCLLDITRRKAAEREAREREDQLLHADKMISLGTMAAGIAHEIHNPNNFILLNAPVLKMAWESTFRRLDEYAEENGDFLIGKLPYSRAKTYIPALVDGIIEGAKRIKTIVRDMKEFVSRKNSGDSEPVDINAVLRSSLNLLASKLKKSTDNLLVEYGENVPAVEANVQRLEQVAINLILNGAESLKDKGGLLSIRSYYEPERASVVVEVRDEGTGIEPENLKRIFDPFFTTKRETGGTGLGLSISQRIIEAYG